MKDGDWRKSYPLVELTWRRRHGPLVRCVRLSNYYYPIGPVGIFWYAIGRWKFWCRIGIPHVWVNYGCPTCSDFCARMCRTIRNQVNPIR